MQRSAFASLPPSAPNETVSTEGLRLFASRQLRERAPRRATRRSRQQSTAEGLRCNGEVPVYFLLGWGIGGGGLDRAACWAYHLHPSAAFGRHSAWCVLRSA